MGLRNWIGTRCRGSYWSSSLGFFLFPMLLVGCSSVDDPSFEFALLGDNPYRPESVPKFETLVQDVNQKTELQWVIHVGDIRGSAAAPCSNEVFQARFELYQQFQFPFVYTPGDNEWFDCGSPGGGEFEDYERLDYIRSLFFPSPGFTTGSRPMEVQTQSTEAGFQEFVENAMWVHGEVVFSTFHLVALTRPPTDPAIARRRMDAAVAWIDRTFARAEELNSRGVFLVSHADPWLVSGLPAVVERICPDCLEPRAGLDRLYPVLEELSIAFSRPVVLAVGDTHVFRVDKPLYSTDSGLLVENFTRVEPFGNPYAHWVRVRVDPRERELFSFHQEIVEDREVQ